MREPNLILLQGAVLVLVLAFALEGDNNETDEDVDHEEGDDNDKNEVEAGNQWPVVVDRSLILRVRIDRHVQQSAGAQEQANGSALLDNHFGGKSAYPGHPSKVETVNKVIMALPTSSKWKSFLSHVRLPTRGLLMSFLS
jgi:hypothetical protein